MKKDFKITGVHYHWGPFLFRSTISDEFRDLILKEGHRARKTTPSMNDKLAGHLDEQYELPPEPFMGHLTSYLAAYCVGFNKWRGRGQMKPDAKLLKLWINFMKAGDFNPPHDHSGDLSFVIFPEVPKKLIKENQAYQGTMKGPGAIAWMIEGSNNRMDIDGVYVLPSDKDIYIFPASLKHWVFPFKSKVTRISVSGNLVFTAHAKAVKKWFGK